MNEIQLDKTEIEKFLEATERSGILYWLEELKEDLIQSITADFSVPEVDSVYDLDGIYSDQNIERKAHQIYAMSYAIRLCKKGKPE